MPAILFLTGTTRGDALGAITRGVAQAFAPYGYEMIEINLTQPDAMGLLERSLQQKDIAFAFSYAAIGRDILLPRDGKEVNLWSLLTVPFIAIHGDSPAYFFDRHVNAGQGFATLYGFREHYVMRKALPNYVGMFGVVPPLMLDAVPVEEIDFAAKEKGKLVFLKNGNDPKKLKQQWRDTCPASIAAMLFEIADALEGAMGTEEALSIDELTTGLFASKGMDVEALTNLRLFFAAQLDDYWRRVKATFIGEVLRDFPVEIHGDNWDHMDFTNSACTFVPVCDYNASRTLIRESLGMIDMSPNTGGGFHDRPLRAYGMHTLCLTNEQQCMTDTFGADSGLTFRFDRESLSQKIADAIANPKRYVELGRSTSETFRALYPSSVAVEYFIEVAGALRLSLKKDKHGMQDFFVWPPQTLAGA